MRLQNFYNFIKKKKLNPIEPFVEKKWLKENVKQEDEVNKKIRSIIKSFNPNKFLGEVIHYYKLSKEDFILNNELECINDDFKDFYKRYKELDNMIYKDFGFGKKMGNNIYIHKNYEFYLPDIKNVKKLIPRDFDYTIIKWDKLNNFFSFIKSSDFDTSHEPVIDDSYKVANDVVKYRPKSKRDQIYHHKWLFVKNNYKGFDYTESKLRSLKWFKKYNYDSNKIGYKDYWDNLNINESYTEDEIKIANKTNRVYKKPGAIGNNPVVINFVEKFSNKNDLILDFGAGKYPLHAIRLKEKGYNVKSHEFGDNFNKDLHDGDFLDYKYDVVYASNVLNVQSSFDMLKSTLDNIKKLMKDDGIFIANYPRLPRKMNISYKEMGDILSLYFNVKNLGRNAMLMKKN